MILDFFIRYAHQIQPEPNSGCWLWRGAAVPEVKPGIGGYGAFRFQRRFYYAHRAAYEATHGAKSAGGLTVRHKCDTPLCVNPDHLLVGTHADNLADMFSRGRGNRARKLTDEQVADIRARHSNGDDYQTLGQHFGITAEMARKIVRRERRTGDTAAIEKSMSTRAAEHAAQLARLRAAS